MLQTSALYLFGLALLARAQDEPQQVPLGKPLAQCQTVVDCGGDAGL